MEHTNHHEHHNDHGCCSSGSSCVGHCGGKHVILRWVLGVAILAIVFSVGVKIVEFKNSIEGGGYYGGFGRHQMMWGGYGDPNNYYSVPPMMRGRYTQGSGSGTAPTIPR